MRSLTTPFSSDFERYLAYGVLVSLVLHLSFLISLAQRHQIAEPEPIFAQIVMDTAPRQVEQPARQIVSTPDHSQTETPPKDTSLLSERDASTEHEQIKRGDLENGPVVGEKAPAKMAMLQQPPQPARKEQAQQPAPKPAEKSVPHAGLRLTLDKHTLMDRFGTQPERSEQNPMQQRPDLGSYKAFSRPAGSGARFLGNTGNADYLPNLPDGDITLLNTKADQFAVFVRRVATQVFGQLRLSGWSSLAPSDINGSGRFATVLAILSLEGKLLKTDLLESSGSPRFDEVVVRAVAGAARDPHPPAAAVATDGNIHFIFKARSWSQPSVGRTGFPSERRWLLLATGLE